MLRSLLPQLALLACHHWKNIHRAELQDLHRRQADSLTKRPTNIRECEYLQANAEIT
jgi:hypothetical protein